jgi:hypothetical protein
MTCIVNPCEKPVELFRKLYRNWAVPGQTVLVLGHGPGPEVEAAVLEGLNVIAVDKCPRQSAHLFVRLEALRIRLAVPPKIEEKEVKLSGVKPVDMEGVQKTPTTVIGSSIQEEVPGGKDGGDDEPLVGLLCVVCGLGTPASVDEGRGIIECKGICDGITFHYDCGLAVPDDLISVLDSLVCSQECVESCRSQG